MNQPVIIAGAGPVGLMLACELGLAGVPAIVVERLGQPSEQSRGMAINPGVIELLSQRGLMEPLRAYGLELPHSHFAHIFMDPTRIPRQHPLNFALAQSRLERQLAERAVALGADLRWGTELAGLAQTESGVAVTVRSASGQDTIQGSFLVGCDGADSTVRAQAQIGFPGHDFPFRGLIGEVAAKPGDPLYASIGVTQRDSGFFTVAPIGPDVLRLTTGEFDVEPDDPDAPVTLTELSHSVERITGLPVALGAPRWLSRWYTPTRQADRYRSGNVFLAGDAAHVHFPLGGQALSTGLEDAVNLGWKLAAEIRGWAQPGLLDTYHDERHPAGARACLTARAQLALLYPMDRVGPLRELLAELTRFEDVTEYLVTMVGGVDVRYSYPDQADPHPLLGTRLPDICVQTAAGETPVTQLLQAGRGVLLDTSGADLAQDAIADWADRVDLVTAKAPAELGATALLLRPDGRVAWATSSDTAGPALTAALRTWFGAPAVSPAAPAS